MWRFQWWTLYIGSLRVKPQLILAYQEVLKWGWRSMNRTVIGCTSFKFKHYLQECTITSGKKILICKQNNEWKIIGDELPPKSPLDVKEFSLVKVGKWNTFLRLIHSEVCSGSIQEELNLIASIPSQKHCIRWADGDIHSPSCQMHIHVESWDSPKNFKHL